MDPAPSRVAELTHVLFMDIVGCSTLPSDDQQRIVRRLQDLVRASGAFHEALQSDEVISLPTGDGMALAFFNKLEAAILCAIEVSNAIQAESLCKIRMGINTGPVFVMNDINGKRNISGAGINRAERVMSCGDAGHILLADNVAETLRHLSWWAGKIHPVGECQVKDGWVRVWSFTDGGIGNPELPRKAKRTLRRRRMIIALDVAAVVLAISTAAAAGTFWLVRKGVGFHIGQDSPSVAVLRFQDQSPEKNHEYLAEGLTDELWSELAKIPELHVAGKASSRQIKSGEDYEAISKRLHVANVLEGSVRAQGTKVRIDTHLIRCADGFCTWTNTFDRETADAFAVEDDIAAAVAGELRVKLLGVKSAKATNPEAHNAVLQGRQFLNLSSKEGLEKAANSFQQAIKLDPRYAPAWAGLARTERVHGDWGDVPMEEAYRNSRMDLERALSLDPNLADAHAAIGYLQMVHDWDWNGARSSFQRARALEPGNVGPIDNAATLARVLGNFDESIKLYRRAADLDPLNSRLFINYGIALYYAGRYQEAKSTLQQAEGITPEVKLAVAHNILGRVYLAQGRGPEALGEMDKEKVPAFRLFGLTLAHHALGQKQESDANLAELIAKFQDAPYQIAEAYAFRGEKDRAFEWLDRAYAQRDSGLSEIKGDPLLKNLEHDPRYAALLKKMHL